MEETITITKKEYDTLVKRDMKLSALEATGVDNWDGWDDAMQLYAESKKENEN